MPQLAGDLLRFGLFPPVTNSMLKVPAVEDSAEFQLLLQEILRSLGVETSVPARPGKHASASPTPTAFSFVPSSRFIKTGVGIPKFS